MCIYSNFAKVYDIFMSDTPYDKWFFYIQNIWNKYKINPQYILDLGCGTGSMECIMAPKVKEIIALDISEDMLSIAKQKTDSLSLNNITYICQNMCKLNIINKFDCVISLCDSINYILEERDLLNLFKNIYNCLNENGVFIFDINTIYKFKNILGQNAFCETTENAAYTWENYFDEEEMLNEFYTNFFIKKPNSSYYERFEEIHYEKAYSVTKIKDLINKSGLTLLDTYDESNFGKINETSERIIFVLKK